MVLFPTMGALHVKISKTGLRPQAWAWCLIQTKHFFSSIHSLLFFLFKLVAIRLELFNLIHPFASFYPSSSQMEIAKSSNTYGNYIHFFLPSLSLDSCHAPFSTAGQPPFFSSILRPLGEFVARGKTSRTALM